MDISIVGSGYVGLVAGACLAECGHRVVCVDLSEETVATINQGRTPIFEEGLEELLERAVVAGTLRATTNLAQAVAQTSCTFICVGTPTGSGGADLRHIESAARSVGLALAAKRTYHVVAVKSTVPPGTTGGLVKNTLESHAQRKVGDGWGLCMTPEFLREGRAVNDFMEPDRIVIGASDERAVAVMQAVFAAFDCPKVVTGLVTAEMTKYVANALFATLISFSNEVANICEAIPGVDVQDVWKGVHLDRRLTPPPEPGQPAGVVEYLWHGLGFGGSCFPKDVAAFQRLGQKVGSPTSILRAVLDTNASQPLRLVNLLRQEMDLRGKTVAILGFAFKPGTDDLRESPALPVIQALLEGGARVVAHDPVAGSRAEVHPAFAEVTLVPDWASALHDADACCLVTAWPEYRLIAPADFRRLMRHPLVVDGRGLYEPAALTRAGVLWRGIGHTPRALSTALSWLFYGGMLAVG